MAQSDQNPIPKAAMEAGKEEGQTPGKVKANPFVTGADGKIHHLALQAENKLPAVYPAADHGTEQPDMK